LIFFVRYFIEFAYNGTRYHGWQKQLNVPSVQQTLEQNLSMLLRETISTTGAGRTDTGVHASQAYAHFDCNEIADLTELVYRLNGCLPKDIAIRRIVPVHGQAHARFDAKKRTYHYLIHRQKEVFLENLSWQYSLPLDVERMNRVARTLLDHNDFECFSKVDTDVNSFLCKIDHAGFTLTPTGLLFTISADRFLRNMVRAIVGTLIEIGRGKMPEDALERIIQSKDRGQAGFSVPAHGLYLARIEYDFIDNPQP
jgi:tRNA pseudouridine38-40 synthase